ncbi:VWA domain-containing protein [Nocardioides convexus]|uniref:VWA domain-containing protein n=1 Tax=Nocardioides convexus TaxID=2712224 RepID=UPI002418A508|nr:VWA domain-containing protein [Nocardioides convexus]
MALLAGAEPGSRAVLVVMDGVSNSIDSDVASLAGARAAREVLRMPLPSGMGTPQSRDAAVRKVFTDAAAAANTAIVAVTDPDSPNPASATFTTVVVEGTRLTWANIGDSRSYWIPDAGVPLQSVGGRLGRPGADGQRRAARGRRDRAAGARDHQVAGPGLRGRRTDRGGAGRHRAGLGAGLLRRAVELRLDARGARRPGTRRGHERARRVSRSPWSPSPTPRAATTTSPPRWPVWASGRMTGRRPQEESRAMAEFSAAVYQNEFLPDGGTDVNAIVTVTCKGAGTAGQSGSGAAGEIIIVDTSGSMGPSTMSAAKEAAQAALAEIVDGTWFAVIAGADRAMLAFPQVSSGPGMVRMDASTRQAASAAIGRFVGSGGTAISTWLDLAGQALRLGHRGHPAARAAADRRREPRAPGPSRRGDQPGHGLLPGGLPRRRHRLAGRRDPPDRAGTARHRRHHPEPRADEGAVRGDHAQRHVPRRRRRLAADVDAAGRGGAVRAAGLADRGGPHRASYGRQPADRRLPDRRVGGRVARLPRGDPGARQGDRPGAGSPHGCSWRSGTTWSPRAWSRRPGPTTPSLTTRIDQQVAHYTGQAELAQMIQEGLAAKASGDEATATTKARPSRPGSPPRPATTRPPPSLRKVVDVESEETGTVRLKRAVDKADEMALDTASTKTTRIRKESS